MRCFYCNKPSKADVCPSCLPDNALKANTIWPKAKTKVTVVRHLHVTNDAMANALMIAMAK